MGPNDPMPRSAAPPRWTRRGFLGLAGGVGGALLLGGCGGAADRKDSGGLTFFYSEGAGQDVVPKKLIGAFEGKHPDVRIASITGGSRVPEIMAAYKASKKALVNVGIFTASAIAQGQAMSMFRQLGDADVPRAGKADPAYRLFGQSAVPFNTNLVGLVYRGDRIEAPTSWLDLLDPKYKGKVGLYDAPQGILLGGLYAVNDALGGDPVTLDKGFEAFAKAAKAGQFSTIYNSNQTQYDAFARGDCVIGASILATQAAWAAQGAKIGYAPPKEGQLAVPLYLAIVQSSSAAQATSGLELLNSALEPANVAEYNRLTVAGSVYADVPASAEQAKMAAFSTEAMQRVRQIDWKRQTEVQAKLVDRWNRDIKSNLSS
ncbi:extracellular solute-binding protein [Amycolatopsis jejuensis]|uniref:extracellular solute-binding protein n=1 Tax=Amycolatopsis jejuensis TaxID=330084 RepID=UPI0012E05A7A|nr:extracellular solute-binding protein [Amycolatopsis jejuensis]